MVHRGPHHKSLAIECVYPLAALSIRTHIYSETGSCEAALCAQKQMPPSLSPPGYNVPSPTVMNLYMFDDEGLLHMTERTASLKHQSPLIDLAVQPGALTFRIHYTHTLLSTVYQTVL